MSEEIMDSICAIIVLTIMLTILIIWLIYEIKLEKARATAKSVTKHQFPQKYQTYLEIKDKIKNDTQFYMHNKEFKKHERN